MITDEKIHVIGKNIEDFKEQLPKDIEFIEVSYNGRDLDIKFKNNHTNNLRYLWIRSMDYRKPNAEYINKTRLYDFDNKFIKPDLYDDKIVKEIRNVISNYKTKIQRKYKDVIDLNINLYKGVNFYKKDNKIIVNKENIYAEFEDNNLIYISDNKYIDDMISYYKNFIRYENNYDCINIGERLLVRTKIVDKAISKTKIYRSHNGKSELNFYILLSILNKILCVTGVIYPIAKVIDNIIKYGFYIKSFENFIILLIPILAVVFYSIFSNSYLEYKIDYIHKGLKEREPYYVLNKSNTDIPGYIDLNINQDVLDKFNLSKKDILKNTKVEKEIEVKNKLEETTKIKINIKEIKDRLIDLNKNLDIANKLDLIEEDDLINKYYIPEMNLTIDKYDKFNDEYKEKVINNIDMLNEILERKINDYYKFGEIEVDVLNNELKSKLV